MAEDREHGPYWNGRRVAALDSVLAEQRTDAAGLAGAGAVGGRLPTNWGDEVVVARARDRTYAVPRVMEAPPLPVGGEGDECRGHVTGTVEVVDGAARWRRVVVSLDVGTLAPSDLQRLPWGKLAEAVLTYHAERTEQQRRAFERARAQTKRRPPTGDRPYRTRDRALLHQVAELRASAPAGMPMHRYIAQQLNYSEGYARRLSAEAAKAFPRLGRRRS